MNRRGVDVEVVRRIVQSGMNAGGQIVERAGEVDLLAGAHLLEACRVPLWQDRRLEWSPRGKRGVGQEVVVFGDDPDLLLLLGGKNLAIGASAVFRPIAARSI